jgi:hypothetical protein
MGAASFSPETRSISLTHFVQNTKIKFTDYFTRYRKKNNIFNSTFESGELPTFIPALANNGLNLGRDRTAAPAATTRVDRSRREITSCHAVR